MLVTVLGSCVSACIRDPVAAVGGMNHFMLPESGGSDWGAASSGMRYGNVAMERLINDILVRGGLRQRLEIKVFGGGNVMKGTSDIGHRNASFVETYLAAESLPIAAADLRGSHGASRSLLPGDRSGDAAGTASRRRTMWSSTSRPATGRSFGPIRSPDPPNCSEVAPCPKHVCSSSTT